MFSKTSSLFFLFLLISPSSSSPYIVPRQCLEIDWLKILAQQNIDSNDVKKVRNCIHDLFKDSGALRREFKDIYDFVTKLANKGTELLAANPSIIWGLYSVSSLLVSYSLAVQAKSLMIDTGYLQDKLEILRTEIHHPLKRIEKFMMEKNGLRKLCESQEDLLEMLNEPLSEVQNIREKINDMLKSSTTYKTTGWLGATVLGGIFVFNQETRIAHYFFVAACPFIIYFVYESYSANKETHKLLTEAKLDANGVEKDLRAARSSLKFICIEEKMTNNANDSTPPFLLIDKLE